jgi:V/A-type H+-transporting ATPase subunit D
MAIRFQYNKTSLQEISKQLRVRERALPTLQNKEAALRVEVKRARDAAALLDEKLAAKIASLEPLARLWNEFDTALLAIEDVRLAVKKIAGVKTPILEEVLFRAPAFSLFSTPAWVVDGRQILRELLGLVLEREFFVRKMQLLEYTRKKTTQKVNLYEKVQIPGYKDATRSIKRFLEDEENLSKAAQKIVKKRTAEADA